jgi:hypothetical protein
MQFKLVEDIDTQYLDNEGNILTTEQVEYFKNSKVRDKDNNLLICYHGSEENHIDVFKELDSYGINAIYFSDSKELGNKFTYNTGKNYQCYLNIINPIIIDAAGKAYNNIIYNNEICHISDILQKINHHNNDGLIIKNIKEYDGQLCNDYIIFKSEQSKLITNKHPTSSKNINETI